MFQNPTPHILDHVTGETLTVTSTQDLTIHERPQDRVTVTLEVGPTQWKVLCAPPPTATESGWRGSQLVISSPAYERRAFDEGFRRLWDALDEARTHCKEFLRTFEEETAAVRGYESEGLEGQMSEVLDRLWRLKVVAEERKKKKEVERLVKEKAVREIAGDARIEEEEPDLTFVSATVVLLHDLADAACALPCHSTELGNEVKGVGEACKQLQEEWNDFRKYVREARKGEVGMKLLCKHMASLHEALGYHAAWWDPVEWLPKEWIDEVSLRTSEDLRKETEARKHFEEVRMRHMTGYGMMWGFRTGHEGV